MIATYELEVECLCPADSKPSMQRATVTSMRCIPVHEIKLAAGELAKLTMYQEDATVWLARRLRATVQMVGIHDGVKIASNHGWCD